MFSISNVDDWRCDQYRWKNRGVHNLPSNKPRVKKMYFIIDTAEGPSASFKRHAYQLIIHSTEVTYIGNKSTAVNFPHHSSLNADRVYIRTRPSYRKELVRTQTPTK